MIESESESFYALDFFRDTLKSEIYQELYHNPDDDLKVLFLLNKYKRVTDKLIDFLVRKGQENEFSRKSRDNHGSGKTIE
jgi:hypothetical protein